MSFPAGFKMNWGWHRQKEVLKTDKATQAESRLAAIKKVRENLRRGGINNGATVVRNKNAVT